jgi:uncharacterized protein (UPF0548 family)
MFLTRRPTEPEIRTFIEQSRALPLSYEPVGIAKAGSRGFKLDSASYVIGHGPQQFARATNALKEWKQFDLGWVEVFPVAAPLEPNTVVAVLIHHLGFWSLNGCRIVYSVGGESDQSEFGFAYGTLTNHAEMGEEIFAVSFDPVSEKVTYNIRAASRPRAALARLGYPYVRLSQSRFRKDSIAAMRRAIDSH